MEGLPSVEKQHIHTYASILSCAWQIGNGKDCRTTAAVESIRGFHNDQYNRVP